MGEHHFSVFLCACWLVCLLVVILQWMSFCYANNLESSSSSLTLITAFRKKQVQNAFWLRGWKEIQCIYWKFPQQWAAWPGHCALVTRGIRQPTPGSHLGSTRVTAGWCGVLWGASSMCTAHRGRKLKLTPVRVCIPKRSAQSAVGEGRGYSLWRRVGWIWSFSKEVCRTLVSIIKALKVPNSGPHRMVQVSWTDEHSGLIPNFSLQKSAESNHSV